MYRKKLSPRKIIQLLLIIAPFGAIVVVGIYFLLLSPSNSDKSNNIASQNIFGWKIPSTGQVQNSDAYSAIRKVGAPKGFPVRLKIPVINVDTAIEDAFITPDGRMDVPAGSVNVAWFALGPRPGQKGNAVIGGHFGIDNGNLKVFYYLNKLKTGDIVYVINDKGDTLAFVVRGTRVFDRNANSTPVFISTDNLAHLNLIACEGIWNQIDDSYPERLVVFTDAIASEGGVSIKAPTETVTPLPPSNTLPEIVENATPSNLKSVPFLATITRFWFITIFATISFVFIIMVFIRK